MRLERRYPELKDTYHCEDSLYHIHPVRLSVFKSCAVVDTRQIGHACLIRIAQARFGPAVCSQVLGRQAVSVSPERLVP